MLPRFLRKIDVIYLYVQKSFPFCSSSSPTQGSCVYQIQSASKQDEGSYICQATSDSGQREEILQIIVIEDQPIYPDERPERPSYPDERPSYSDERPSYSDERPSYPDERPNYPEERPNYPNEVLVQDSVLAPVNGNARLSCQVVGNAQGLSVKWVRTDGRELSQNAYQLNGELFIQNVQQSDGGPYGCQALDPNGRVIFTANTILRISSKSSIINIKNKSFDFI